ncbi:MAG: DUF1003 domain-containing protein [Pseudomonadota bacterium]|nr:DUF1003 domain-containing protein [Pseudomonadota bacterium]
MLMDDDRTFGENIADAVASFGGSWRFIIIFAVTLIVYTLINSLLGRSAWDPYPFILLNLFLSMIAAIQAPIIMMSQNRQAKKDRELAQKTEEEARDTLLKSIEINTECHRIMKLFLLETRRLKQLINTLQEKQ